MEIVQQALPITHQKWCDERQLRINRKKTYLVPFTNRRIKVDLKLQSLYGDTIPFTNEVK